MRQLLGSAVLVLVGLLTVGGCGDDDDDEAPRHPDGSPDNAGQTCNAADDCYRDVADGTIKGEITCLNKVPDGYCTHFCTADTDCCAVDDECKTDLKQVCSPFEDVNGKMCFLSCEDVDVPAGLNETEYCQREMGTSWHCESSGGGNENRKVCIPADCSNGGICDGNEDCATGLVCNDGFRDGYCGKRDCTTNAECGPNSRCATIDGVNYCLHECNNEWDCATCRPADRPGTCRSDVQFAEAGTTGSVCVPPT